MQKKLIAMAVAGFASGAAFAQSNVTVYGILDMAYIRAKADGADTRTFINSGGMSGSRLGFKGVEDLGNGLKAVFNLEWGVEMDQQLGLGQTAAAGASASNSATSTTGNRHSFVGLSGGFGTVAAGRMQTAGYDFACTTSPIAGGIFDAYQKIGVYSLLSCSGAGRANNAFAYISPSFGGLTLAYNHGRVSEGAAPGIAGIYTGVGAASAAKFSDAYANLFAATYDAGPLAVRGVYSKINAKDLLPGNIKEWGLNGSYDLGVAKLYASYQTRKDDASGDKDKKWGIAAGIPVGPTGTVAVQYAKTNMDNSDKDAKGWSIAYIHGLSKRTDVYAGYNRVNNDDLANKASITAPVLAGDSSSAFGFGLRHRF
jgi:predicted porin